MKLNNPQIPSPNEEFSGNFLKIFVKKMFLDSGFQTSLLIDLP
jgi:hypothetical protein